jgi:hypothetical protein
MSDTHRRQNISDPTMNQTVTGGQGLNIDMSDPPVNDNVTNHLDTRNSISVTQDNGSSTPPLNSLIHFQQTNEKDPLHTQDGNARTEGIIVVPNHDQSSNLKLQQVNSTSNVVFTSTVTSPLAFLSSPINGHYSLSPSSQVMCISRGESYSPTIESPRDNAPILSNPIGPLYKAGDIVLAKTGPTDFKFGGTISERLSNEPPYFYKIKFDQPTPASDSAQIPESDIERNENPGVCILKVLLSCNL